MGQARFRRCMDLSTTNRPTNASTTTSANPATHDASATPACRSGRGGWSKACYAKHKSEGILAWNGTEWINPPLSTKGRTCTYEGGKMPCACTYTCANGKPADDDDGPWNACTSEDCDGFSDDCGGDSTSEWLPKKMDACPEAKLGPKPTTPPQAADDDPPFRSDVPVGWPVGVAVGIGGAVSPSIAEGLGVALGLALGAAAAGVRPGVGGILGLGGVSDEQAARPWNCTAKCNVRQFDRALSCPDRAYGSASGPSEYLACQAAMSSASASTPRGCYSRHCQCSCWN